VEDDPEGSEGVEGELPPGEPEGKGLEGSVAEGLEGDVAVEVGDEGVGAP
jgi:hypothetical protein